MFYRIEGNVMKINQTETLKSSISNTNANNKQSNGIILYIIH